MTDDPINIDEEEEHDDEYEEGYGEAQGGSNGMWTKNTKEVPESECGFTSILELRDQVRKRGNSGTSHLTSPIPLCKCRGRSVKRSQVYVTHDA